MTNVCFYKISMGYCLSAWGATEQYTADVDKSKLWKPVRLDSCMLDALTNVPRKSY